MLDEFGRPYNSKPTDPRDLVMEKETKPAEWTNHHSFRHTTCHWDTFDSEVVFGTVMILHDEELKDSKVARAGWSPRDERDEVHAAMDADEDYDDLRDDPDPYGDYQFRGDAKIAEVDQSKDPKEV